MLSNITSLGKDEPIRFADVLQSKRMNQWSQILHVIGSLKSCLNDVDIFNIISNEINVIDIK